MWGATIYSPRAVNRRGDVRGAPDGNDRALTVQLLSPRLTDGSGVRVGCLSRQAWRRRVDPPAFQYSKEENRAETDTNENEEKTKEMKKTTPTAAVDY